MTRNDRTLADIQAGRDKARGPQHPPPAGTAVSAMENRREKKSTQQDDLRIPAATIMCLGFAIGMFWILVSTLVYDPFGPIEPQDAFGGSLLIVCLTYLALLFLLGAREQNFYIHRLGSNEWKVFQMLRVALLVYGTYFYLGSRQLAFFMAWRRGPVLFFDWAGGYISGGEFWLGVLNSRLSYYVLFFLPGFLFVLLLELCRRRREQAWLDYERLHPDFFKVHRLPNSKWEVILDNTAIGLMGLGFLSVVPAALKGFPLTVLQAPSRIETTFFVGGGIVLTIAVLLMHISRSPFHRPNLKGWLVHWPSLQIGAWCISLLATAATFVFAALDHPAGPRELSLLQYAFIGVSTLPFLYLFLLSQRPSMLKGKNQPAEVAL